MVILPNIQHAPHPTRHPFGVMLGLALLLISNCGDPQEKAVPAHAVADPPAVPISSANHQGYGMATAQLPQDPMGAFPSDSLLLADRNGWLQRGAFSCTDGIQEVVIPAFPGAPGNHLAPSGLLESEAPRPLPGGRARRRDGEAHPPIHLAV